MKKRYLLLIVAIAMIGIIGICVSCGNGEKPQPQMAEPTNIRSVENFYYLKKIFPRTLLLPETFTNESIEVVFDNYVSASNYVGIIQHDKVIEQLIGGEWVKYNTDYMISVSFHLNNNLDDVDMPGEYEEGEIHGYKIFQLKSNQEIFLFDEANEIVYSIWLSPINGYNAGQRDNILRDYINEMIRL